MSDNGFNTTGQQGCTLLPAACRYVELLDTLALDQHFLKIQRREEPDSKEEKDRCGCLCL